jgi:hypothetical protein
MRPHIEPSVPVAPDTANAMRRFQSVAEILARGVRRHLALGLLPPPFSTGRSSEKPSESQPSALASSPETSVTVHAG